VQALDGKKTTATNAEGGRERIRERMQNDRKPMGDERVATPTISGY
jgi:hypothetical protein